MKKETIKIVLLWTVLLLPGCGSNHSPLTAPQKTVTFKSFMEPNLSASIDIKGIGVFDMTNGIDGTWTASVPDLVAGTYNVRMIYYCLKTEPQNKKYIVAQMSQDLSITIQAGKVTQVGEDSVAPLLDRAMDDDQDTFTNLSECRIGTAIEDSRSYPEVVLISAGSLWMQQGRKEQVQVKVQDHMDQRSLSNAVATLGADILSLVEIVGTSTCTSGTDGICNFTVIGKQAGTVDLKVTSGKEGEGSSGTSTRLTIAPLEFAIGGTVSGLIGSVVLQTNGNADLTVTTNGAFIFTMPVIQGNPYSVTAFIQPIGQNCTLANGSGIATANVTDIVVTCVNIIPRFAYVANAGDNTISIYTVNVITGQLRANGYISTGGFSPVSITVDPYQIAYVADAVGNLLAYTINAATGALTELSSSPFVAGSLPNAVTVYPIDKFVYVVNSNANDVEVYAVEATTGAQSLLNTVRTRSGPLAIAIAKGTTAITYRPKFAYVANFNSANLFAYTINATTGALTEVSDSPVKTGEYPYSVTVDPFGKFAYVTNYGTSTLSAYTINPTTGLLTEMTGSPFSTGKGPTSVIIDPSGRFAYVANFNAGTLSAYTINIITGALTELSDSPFVAGTNPRSVTIDPSGRFAYVANDGPGKVSAYAINAITGALTELSGSPFTAGSRPAFVTVDPSGKFAYTANYLSNDLSAYTINAITGALTELSGSPFTSGSFPFSVTIDRSGKFAYVANFKSVKNLSTHSINTTTGLLTELSSSPFTTGGFPTSVTIDPSGKFTYTANNASNNLSAHAINPTTGALIEVSGSPFTAGTGPVSVTTTGTIQ